MFVGFVKLNVGNFASDVLAPVIGNVPIVRSILPKEFQEKTADQRAAILSNMSVANASQITVLMEQ